MLKLLNNSALSRRFLTGLAPMLLLGCSTVPISSGKAMAQSDDAERPLPGQAEESARMDSQLMFELMISELAGRRGQLDVAMTGYLRAAERTDDPRVSERAARLAMFGRQWPEAEWAAQRWLFLDEQSSEARPVLAQALMRQGKVTEAADQLIAIIAEAEDQDRVLRQLPSDIEGAQSLQQGVDIVKRVLDAYPDNAQGHLSLARAQTALGDQSAALSSVDSALTIDGTDPAGLLLKAQLLVALDRADEGFSLLQTDLSMRPGRTWLRLGLARLLVEAGRYDDAEEQLDRLHEGAAGNSDTLLTISLLAIDSRRIARAETYLQSLLETGDYSDQAYFYLARINDQRQDHKAAIAQYEAVPGGDLRLRAQIRIAELVAIGGDLEQGRERLREIALQEPNPALQPRLLTAESRMLQNAGQSAEAVVVLTAGLERFPDNADLLYSRALASDGAGDPAMMLDDLNRLIELDSENAHALNALGYHFADNNIELARADTLLVKANQLLPNDPAIMDSLGWLRYRQGNLQEAEKWLSEAYALYPDTEIASHLGEVLWLAGKKEQAKQLIEEALIEHPDDEKLLQVKQKFTE